MRRTDIPDSQIRRACAYTTEALRELRESGEGRWWEDDYCGLIDEMLFFGRYWRRVAKINSVESARRELLYVAEQLNRLVSGGKQRTKNSS